MDNHTPATAASRGTRARRPGRTLLLLLGVTLTGLGGAVLLSPVSPFIETTVAITTAPQLRMPTPATSVPEPVQLDRLVRRDRVESTQTRPAAPARQAEPPARPAITIAPDKDTADFVPTPEPPTPTLETRRAVAAQPAAPAHIDDPTTDQPARARDTVANIQYQKLDMALQQALETDPATPVRVILRTARGAHEMAAWLAAEGRQIHQLHASIGGLTATLSASDVAALTTDSNVQRMSIDAVVHATAEPVSGDVFRGTLGLDALGGVISGGAKWAGLGVRVAVVDSGIKTGGDLDKNRILAFFDFTQPPDSAEQASNPKDEYGHGTHVAGLIGGTGRESEGEYQGPATAVTFVVFRVLNEHGAGYTSDVLAAIDYAVQQNATFGIDVMNLSLGHPIFEPAATDPLVQAVEAAVASGIVVVTSAGNIGMNPETGEVGYAGITSPGNAPGAITVGSLDLHYTATRFDDTVGPYISRGPTWL